ncbi:MAG TPA: PRC-barrel domain-containing protein [Gemmatirosa sp.]
MDEKSDALVNTLVPAPVNGRASAGPSTPISASSPTLARLSRLDGWRVADGDADVRGWAVWTPDGLAVGTVIDLIVDPDAQCVRYVEVGRAAAPRGPPMLLPIGNVRLDAAGARVAVDLLTLQRIAALTPETREAGAAVDVRRRRGTRALTVVTALAAVIVGATALTAHGAANPTRRARASVARHASDGDVAARAVHRTVVRTPHVAHVATHHTAKRHTAKRHTANHPATDARRHSSRRERHAAHARPATVRPTDPPAGQPPATYHSDKRRLVRKSPV